MTIDTPPAVQFTDITALLVLFSPDQGQETHDTLLARLQDALAKGARVVASNYSIDDPDILSTMTEIGKAVPASRFLFDSSEFFGEKEKPLVEALIAALAAEQWGIGTSSVDGNILHDKVIVAIYPDGSAWTFTGSFNITASAQKEANNAWFIDSAQCAAAFAAEIEKNLAWVQANQPQPPTEKPSY
jgi:phosphatidylserine/phosphatidylglycerophosphate/cardiolipin synthase-like enzyme